MRSHGLRAARVASFVFCVAATALAQTPYSCPSCDLANTDFTTGGYALAGANLSNANLTGANFTGLDLTEATLSGANLTDATFNNANLTKADISGTRLTSTSFREAVLTKANFQFARFDCTVIASSDVSEATFGPALTLPTTAPCRTSFASTTMNCQFIQQWKDLDLTGADIGKCFTHLSGVDFTHAVMPGVVFSSGDLTIPTDLSNTNWRGANLAGANFTSAVLTNADFSGTKSEPGANLTNASLTYVLAEHAKFDYASLGNDPTSSQPAARLDFAHLAGASFTNANLRLTDFSGANVTGQSDVFANSNLNAARFSGANLSAIDLSKVGSALGIDLSNANLANVNLKGVDFGPAKYRTSGGTETVVPSSFVRAFLCGAVVDHTNLDCANMTGAYMPTTDTMVKADDGRQIDCRAITFIDPVTNGVPSTGIGCFTICPNGTPGPCTGTKWAAGGVPPPPCCIATPTKACPPAKRDGFSCTSNCDCKSRRCTGGLCQPQTGGQRQSIEERAP